MVEKVEFAHENNIVHGVYGLHNDFTFCTIAIMEQGVEHNFTNKKITCKECIRVVEYFKSIKAIEIKK